jgi:hypothetical protein
MTSKTTPTSPTPVPLHFPSSNPHSIYLKAHQLTHSRLLPLRHRRHSPSPCRLRIPTRPPHRLAGHGAPFLPFHLSPHPLPSIRPPLILPYPPHPHPPLPRLLPPPSPNTPIDPTHNPAPPLHNPNIPNVPNQNPRRLGRQIALRDQHLRARGVSPLCAGVYGGAGDCGAGAGD